MKNNARFKINNFIGGIIIIGSVFLLLRGLYAYFFLKGLALSKLLLGVLFFGVCAVVGVILLISKDKDIFINPQQLNKQQAIIMIICSLIFSFCMLYGSLFTNLSIPLKLILFVGSLFFGIGSIILLFKTTRR